MNAVSLTMQDHRILRHLFALGGGSLIDPSAIALFSGYADQGLVRLTAKPGGAHAVLLPPGLAAIETSTPTPPAPPHRTLRLVPQLVP